MIGIYKIKNPTGRVYIGQSWDISGRKSQYKGLHCKDQPAVYRSITKYGWEAHVFEVVHQLPEDISQEVLDKYEILYWEQYLRSGINMLNAKEPGRGGKHLESTKRKISDTKLGRKHSEQTKFKIQAKLKGRLATRAICPVEQYKQDGTYVAEFRTQTAAALSVGVKQSSAICECCQGKRRTYKGYIWKYKTK